MSNPIIEPLRDEDALCQQVEMLATTGGCDYTLEEILQALTGHMIVYKMLSESQGELIDSFQDTVKKANSELLVSLQASEKYESQLGELKKQMFAPD